MALPCYLASMTEQKSHDPYRSPVPSEVDALRERVARLEASLAHALSRLAKVDYQAERAVVTINGLPIAGAAPDDAFIIPSTRSPMPTMQITLKADSPAVDALMGLSAERRRLPMPVLLTGNRRPKERRRHARGGLRPLVRIRRALTCVGFEMCGGKDAPLTVTANCVPRKRSRPEWPGWGPGIVERVAGAASAMAGKSAFLDRLVAEQADAIHTQRQWVTAAPDDADPRDASGKYRLERDSEWVARMKGNVTP